MSGYPLFWTIVFAIAVILFVLVEVVVIVGSIGDIANMTHSLQREKEDIDKV